jgi:flagellar basal body-associated protein FliL
MKGAFEMEKKSNAKKIIIGIIGIIIVAVLCIVMWFVYNGNKKNPIDGGKTITIQVESERDNYSFEKEYNTELEYLGDFLEEENLIEFDEAEYGRYITAVQGYAANNEEQSWWNISVNGESAMTGVDEIVLEDASVYRLELKIGW